MSDVCFPGRISFIDFLMVIGGDDPKLLNVFG